MTSLRRLRGPKLGGTIATLLLVSVVGMGAAGCLLVPVPVPDGGGYGRHRDHHGHHYHRYPPRYRW